MIGIDTNIVLRYLLKDDPALSPRALEIIAADDCFVTRAALTDLAWGIWRQGIAALRLTAPAAAQPPGKSGRVILGA